MRHFFFAIIFPLLVPAIVLGWTITKPGDIELNECTTFDDWVAVTNQTKDILWDEAIGTINAGPGLNTTRTGSVIEIQLNETNTGANQLLWLDSNGNLKSSDNLTYDEYGKAELTQTMLDADPGDYYGQLFKIDLDMQSGSCTAPFALRGLARFEASASATFGGAILGQATSQSGDKQMLAIGLEGDATNQNTSTTMIGVYGKTYLDGTNTGSTNVAIKAEASTGSNWVSDGLNIALQAICAGDAPCINAIFGDDTSNAPVYLKGKINGSEGSAQMTISDVFDSFEISVKDSPHPIGIDFVLGANESIKVKNSSYSEVFSVDDTGLISTAQTVQTAATSGGATLPAQPVGFLKIVVNGVTYKLPLYAE